jgi:hypothetical protein
MTDETVDEQHREPSPDQLAMAVDAGFLVTVQERRAEGTSLTLGPLPEHTARALAGLLLNRLEPPVGPGPWQCAIAGGSRAVTLTHVS